MEFFKDYMKFIGESEAPMIYHRWSCISMIGSLVGRNAYLPFGHSTIYPNQYILLMGTPGTRKSTAIGISKGLLAKAGYDTFAAARTSKERFFLDMVKKISEYEYEDLEALVLDSPSEVTIANGEFLDFIGQGNMDFLTALTNLWDNLDTYEHPKLHGKSVLIYKPTINILGGATVKGLGMAIPPEALGTGILSRLLMIHAEPTDVQITWPEEVAPDASDKLVENLKEIKAIANGKMGKTQNAGIVLDKMYKGFPGLEDGRLADYSARRFSHLLKLTMIIALSNLRLEMTAEDALQANTILHAAERKMTKAFGEYGKSRFSDVSNTIMEALGKTHKPLSHNEIWRMVAKDLSDSKDLGIVMKNLVSSEKAQVITVAGKQGYMPKHREVKEWDKDLLLEDYLTAQENF